MFDIEKAKTILQNEVDKREEAFSRYYNAFSASSFSEYVVEFQHRRYVKFCSRLCGMMDMLFDMGYLVWVNDDKKIVIEKRVDYLEDEIPF